MAIHWKIPFRSLRAGTLYSVNIYDASYSGAPVTLKGGAEPFETSEDDDEDAFTPVRKQSGSLRIVDDGLDTDGNAFNWKALVPETDISRPVTLTDGGGNVLWMGTMQAQNFSGELYGDPQEREFPVQCPLTVLSAVSVTTSETVLQNFAYLIRYMMQSVPAECRVTNYAFQGGADARSWLLTKFDWQNFTNVTEEGVEAKYHLDSVMEDVCRFWGWTVRIQGQTAYFCCADDLAEQNWLTLTSAQMDSLAGGSTSAGSVVASATATLSGTVFASDEQDDYKQRGPHKVTVKADVNDEDTILAFAPKSVEDQMDEGGYTWVQGGEDLVGYFTTPEITSFTSPTLDGQAILLNGTYLGGFCRRQIYSSTEADSSETSDIINIKQSYLLGDQEAIRLQSKRAMPYGGGSLKINGSIFVGAEKYTETEEEPTLYYRLGIGMTRASAKWWHCRIASGTMTQVDFGWSAYDSRGSICNASIAGGQICSIGDIITSQYIPVDQGMFGYIFIDILGMMASSQASLPEFQIADFSIEFTRDETNLPTSTDIVRPRVMKEKRETSQEYTATNSSQVQDEMNVDCIFASDNNLEYGFGLLMDSNARFLAKVPYGSTTDHPEQHLANRIAAYWAKSKRRLSLELRQDHLIVGAITPRHYVTVDNTRCHPASISHNWRDDVTKITFLETPSSY